MMDKKVVVRSVFVIWIAVWVLFLVRPYFKKDLAGEYASLIRLSPDGKRAYIAGVELYDFVTRCNNSIGAPSAYKIVGLEDRPLDHVRAVYYLYPNIESDRPKFILDFERLVLERAE